EYSLLGQSVHDHQDSSVLNEIHRDGVPWLFQYWQLFQGAIWSVSGCFGSHTCSAGPHIFFDKGVNAGPGVLSPD
ncbi:hypothetical protein M404DRAFT_151877, partial [Pisolithus tinctorius Marx 270]